MFTRLADRRLSAMEQSRESKHDAGAAPARTSAKRHESVLPELRENVNLPSPQLQPAESSNGLASAGQQSSAVATDKSIAHSAALHRLNGSKTKTLALSQSASTANTQPVLVRAYPTVEEDSAMRRSRRNTPLEPTIALPPLSAFSVQDILKEIDQEIAPSVDAIAEIFGRSKLSLADEHSSHLPPQGEIIFPATQEQREVLGAVSNARLEPVEETTPAHARRQSLALVGSGASAQAKGNAVAATTMASVEPVTGRPLQITESEADTKASLLPYVLSWLRSSNMRNETPSSGSSMDLRAAETLQKILGET